MVPTNRIAEALRFNGLTPQDEKSLTIRNSGIRYWLVLVVFQVPLAQTLKIEERFFEVNSELTIPGVEGGVLLGCDSREEIAWRSRFGCGGFTFRRARFRTCRGTGLRGDSRFLRG